MTTNSSLMSSALTNKISIIETDIKTIKGQITNLQTLYGSCVSLSTLRLSENILKKSISDLNNLIADIEERLTKIKLPTDTRYYLNESEISDFRSNFQKLTAMMADFQRLYASLVAYTTNVK